MPSGLDTSHTPVSGNYASSKGMQTTDQPSQTSFLGTSSSHQTKTIEAVSTTSTTGRLGIDISLSFSPTTSEQAAPSPQQPSELHSSADQSTASTDNTIENTASRIQSSEEFSSTALLTGSSPSEQATEVPTSEPTPVCEEGLEYAVYLFKDGSPECAALERTTQSGDTLNLDLATVIESKTPTATGKYPELDLSDASIDDHCVAVGLRG